MHHSSPLRMQRANLGLTSDLGGRREEESVSLTSNRHRGWLTRRRSLSQARRQPGLTSPQPQIEKRVAGSDAGVVAVSANHAVLGRPDLSHHLAGAIDDATKSIAG